MDQVLSLKLALLIVRASAGVGGNTIELLNWRCRCVGTTIVSAIDAQAHAGKDYSWRCVMVI